MAIVTDLVDAELYPAAELLEHYLQRWGIYNLIQLIRGYVAAHQQRRTEPISIENLFLEVHRQMTAWSVLVESKVPPEIPVASDLPALADRLHALLASPWTNRWIKAVNKNRRPHAAKPHERTHGSVFRVVQRSKPKPEI